MAKMRTSSQSCLDQLNALKRQLEQNNLSFRVVVVGIGQELRGDDFAGSKVARDLLKKMPADQNRLILDTGPAPENFTGPIRRFAPDLVILVDAADMGAEPGEIRWLDWKDTQGLSASTHTLPPYVLAEFLTQEVKCAVALIGIQPASTEMDIPMSPEVRRATKEVTQILLKAL